MNSDQKEAHDAYDVHDGEQHGTDHRPRYLRPYRCRKRDQGGQEHGRRLDRVATASDFDREARRNDLCTVSDSLLPEQAEDSRADLPVEPHARRENAILDPGQETYRLEPAHEQAE
jgi:hypothetical protein